MEELKNIETSLTELHKDFNKQLEALGNDSTEFHNALIDLSSKYPDHKELIQFIVFINDKIETNQTLFQDVVVESFNELIKVKKTLVNKMIQEKEVKINTEMLSDKILKYLVTMKDMKLVMISIAIIFLTIGVILIPDVFVGILNKLASIKAM
ncbi:MAG: hypothetical protein KAI79_13655 [Bacteroidales bacterium]|nr:hypothetical protein [Bacteroidales bacterium]